MKIQFNKVFDEFLDDTREKASQGVCGGCCEEHTLPVEVVRVVDNRTGADWGWYSYCQAALEEDRQRGLDFIVDSRN
jgi:hypothetical protein